MQRSETASDLLKRCIEARERGASFPDVWNTVLKRHPLVAGMPVQRMESEVALLEIPLVSGLHILFGPDGYRLT